MGALSRRLPEKDLIERVLRSYGVSSNSDKYRQTFVAQHLDLLATSDNESVARSGYVLKRAQDGFGLGYKVPLAIIAIGQVMLGLDLAVTAPFIAANPAAFTCASIGAVYYGYSALDENERQILHRKIGDAIDVGVELVRSIVEFCVATLKSLLSKETLSAMRDIVSDYAQQAGSSLAEITGKVSDKAWEIGEQAIEGAGYAANSAIGAASAAWEYSLGKVSKRTADK